MIIIEVTYKQSLEQVERYLTAHRDYLQSLLNDNKLLASGPQQPRTGGMIIALGDKKEATSIVENDPFYQHDIADFRVIEFTPVLHCDELATRLG